MYFVTFCYHVRSVFYSEYLEYVHIDLEHIYVEMQCLIKTLEIHACTNGSELIYH